MGIQYYPQSNGSSYDPSKYKSLNKDGAVNVTASNTWFTAYTYNGKGLLKRAILAYGSSSAPTLKLRVTVDGVVTFLTTMSPDNGTATIAGILSEEHVRQNGNSLVSRNGASGAWYLTSGISQPSVVDYPYTTDSVRAICFLQNPVFFNTSLLVEVLITSGTFNGVQYGVSGALYTG